MCTTKSKRPLAVNVHMVALFVLVLYLSLSVPGPGPGPGLVAATATSCPPRYYCPDGSASSKIVCPIGSYCPVNSTVPILCNDTMPFNATIQIRPSPAAPGPSPGPGSGAGSAMNGWYCPNATSWPVACPSGYYCPTDAPTSDPVVCPEGSFCPPSVSVPYDDGSASFTRRIAAQYGTANKWTYMLSVAVDSMGNSYVGGYLKDDDTEYRIPHLIKLNSQGQEQWRYEVDVSSGSKSYSVAVDRDDNILFSGYTGGDFDGPGSHLGSDDMFIVKLDGSKTELWRKQLGTSNSDRVRGIDVDSKGHVFLAGGTSIASKYDALLIKLNSDGSVQWEYPYATHHDEYLYDVAVDQSDNAIVVGYVEPEPGYDPFPNFIGGEDALIAKVDAQKNLLWLKVFGTSGDEKARYVALDAATDSIYVTGTTTGSFAAASNGDDNDDDVFVIKFDPDGNELWRMQFGSSDGDSVGDIAVDAVGNVVLVGNTDFSLFDRSNGNNDVYLLKLDSFGSQLSRKQWGTSSNDYGGGVAVSHHGCDVYIVGYTFGNLYDSIVGDMDGFLEIFEVSCSPGASVPVPCSTTEYCPEKSAHPTVCPAGYYCPERQTMHGDVLLPIHCPKGLNCPANSRRPLGSLCSEAVDWQCWPHGRFGIDFSDPAVDVSRSVPNTQFIAAADIDGDSDDDIIGLSQSGNGLSFFWHENQGDGKFGGTSIIDDQTQSGGGFVTADVDLDGDIDIVATANVFPGGDAHEVFWYENIGNAQFNKHVIDRPGITALPTSVACDDIDGDGFPEIVTEYQVYKNNGGGVFSSVHRYGRPCRGQRSVSLADVDGDGDKGILNCVHCNCNRLSVLIFSVCGMLLPLYR
jgi:FG-GAP-like repeat